MRSLLTSHVHSAEILTTLGARGFDDTLWAMATKASATALIACGGLIALSWWIKRNKPSPAVLVGQGAAAQELDESIKRFQSLHGLVPDGIVGPETIKALQEASARLKADAWQKQKLRADLQKTGALAQAGWNRGTMPYGPWAHASPGGPWMYAHGGPSMNPYFDDFYGWW